MKKPLFILVKKQNILIYVCIIILTFLLTSMFFSVKKQNTIAAGSFPNRIPLAANGMEPEAPQDMDDLPFYSRPMPSKVIPVSVVIQKGSEIPLEFIYNNPD